MRDPGGKRELIKDQATRLFVERGVDAVSVRDIAAACEMKPSNLYAHFASREALVAELFHDGYGEYGEIMANIATSPGPFRTRLECLIREICRLHDQDTVRFRFLVLTQHGFLHHVEPTERNPVEVICHTVAEAMDSGEIPRREVELMALAIIGLIVQPATGLLYGRLTGGLLERADTIVAMCWRVLTLP
ncbi:MAG: TetR/AcrR family transcriptional regulator [Acetobacteraceae bacterium]|jgi:AcrR family transcriptional regulator